MSTLARVWQILAASSPKFGTWPVLPTPLPPSLTEADMDPESLDWFESRRGT
jgi:hypothetical protein